MEKYENVISALYNECPNLSVKKLSNVKKIITHGNGCPDGKASAMLLNKAYGGLIPIEFISHGSAEYYNLIPEEGMLFCDFSPPSDSWEYFLSAGAIVLDHHKGTEGIVKHFVNKGLGVFADE